VIFLLAAFFIFQAHAADGKSPGDPACSKGYITLRKGPGPSFPVSWKVARYMPFLKFENKNGWVRVQDLDGETHWAQGKDLTSATHCLVVKSQVATLRREPSATGAPADLKTIDRYTPMKRLESQGEWLHVEDEAGRQAWIHESNIWKPVRVQSMEF
jgi:SH3-like domain-containing protein